MPLRVGTEPSAAMTGLLMSVLALGSCSQGIEATAHAGPAEALPEVTVAQPLARPIEERIELTGRAEAVDQVEIRARATGYLDRVLFREGTMVKKGDLLFVVDPRPYDAALARARAELDRSKVDERLAQRDADRAERLFKSAAISEREWDTESSTLAQLLARTQVAVANVSSAALDVDYAYVRAPISGKIGRIQVTSGNLVGPSLPTALTTLVSTDPLYVYVDVDEEHALRLTKGANGPIGAKVGFADELGHPHDGSVDFLDNHVDRETGTLRVRVVVDNRDGRLTPGLFARVELPEGSPHDSLLVAGRAIGTDQDRRYVLVVTDDGVVQHRPVKLGPLFDGLRVVRDGLTVHDHVMVRGLQRAHPGAKVKAEVVVMSSEIESKHAEADVTGGSK